MYKDRDKDEGRKSWNLKAAKVLEKYSCRLATYEGEIQRTEMILNINQKLKRTGKL